MRAILKATCQRPRDREENINKMVRVNNFQGDDLVDKEFGIQVKNELALVDARVLPPPMVITCQYVTFSREVILAIL